MILMEQMVKYANGKSAMKTDLYRLYGLACSSNADVMVEIGCRWGASTCAMLAALEDVGGRVLHSIDIDERYRKPFSNHPQRVFTLGNSKDPELPAKIGITEIGFLFLDTTHQAKDTVVELPIWLQLIKPGGVAVFHDTKAFREGVVPPVMDYIANDGGENNWSYKEYDETWTGIAVIRQLS